MIYLLAALLSVALANDIPPCIMADCGNTLGVCLGDLMGPDADTVGFQCLIDNADANCNQCLMQISVDEGAPECYKDDCPASTLACFATGETDDAVIAQCFQEAGVDNTCMQCLNSGGDNNNGGGGNNNGGGGNDDSDSSIDMSCIETDCDLTTCGAAFGASEDAGMACLLGLNDDDCNACLMSAASQSGAPSCYAQDCPVSTMACFFGDNTSEKASIACVKAMETNDDCETCIKEYEEKQKKKKSGAATLSMVAAVGATLLALF